jgi:dihydroorotate dehydrogenase (fumarate)
LFEEEIEAEAARPEFQVGPKDYLEQVKRAKSSVKVPIIGSLNCTTLGGWISYARQIAEAGADALEHSQALRRSEPADRGRPRED